MFHERRLVFIVVGLFAVSRSIAAVECQAGEYSSLNGTVCVACEQGKYAPQALVDACVDCDVGKYAPGNRSESCEFCAEGWSSRSGSSRCEIAAKYYYLSPSLDTAIKCPNYAKCHGDSSGPVPVEGYWVDRSDYKYAGNVLRCSRDSCLGGNYSSLCWQRQNYNNASNSLTQCSDGSDGDDLQCEEGSYGPLCGSCSSDYVYWGVVNECVECEKTVALNVTVLLITVGVIVLLFSFRSMISNVKFSRKFKKRMSPLRVFSFVDSGSLKVVWVTYQIVSSASYSLNLKFPQPFRSMLSILSFFSLEFLNYECGFNSNQSGPEDYFSSVYLYCCIPLMFAMIVLLTGLARYLIIIARRKAPEVPAYLSNHSLSTKDLIAKDVAENGEHYSGLEEEQDKEQDKVVGTTNENQTTTTENEGVVSDQSRESLVKKLNSSSFSSVGAPVVNQQSNGGEPDKEEDFDNDLKPLRDSIIVGNRKKADTERERDNLLEIEWLKVKTVINQHCWLLTFIIYVVLPPVSSKLFQVFDCIHINDRYVLRVDTAVSCESQHYLNFRAYMMLLLIIYQLIPIVWFIILFMKREALNPSISTLDKQLAVYIRDHSSSLAPLNFLFYDYKCNKWYFEVVDMYRRILFIAVIPLVSASTSTKASLGCILAVFSVVFYREEMPFGVPFTNSIANFAQYAILVTYYCALALDNDSVISFGLSEKGGGKGIGVILVVANLFVIGLSFWYGWTCYQEHMKKKEDKENMAAQYEDARGFSEVKFKTTFEAMWIKSIPSSYALVFCYISVKDAKLSRKSGLRAHKKFNGIALTLRQPHATTQADFDVFGDGTQGDVSGIINPSKRPSQVLTAGGTNSGSMSESPTTRPFPNQIVFVLSLQQQFLEPLPGYEQDEGLCMISADVLHALRPTSFTAVLDEKPWIHGIALLPPSNILRSYLIMDKNDMLEGNEEGKDDEEEEEEDEDDDENSTAPTRVREEIEAMVVMDISLLEHRRLPCDKVLHVNSSMDYVQAMTFIRQKANALDLLPLYHYTSPHIAPIILKTGLRMSSQGQGDGGVYVSTLGPALYGLGTDQFETNIIKDCFGVERIDEYIGKNKLDVVIVYGCCGKVLEQTPGGRDNARMFSKSTFASFSLENKTGNYFLRPDRILGAFLFDHSKPFPLTPDSLQEIKFEYKREIEVIARVKRAQSKLRQNSVSIGATLTKMWKKQHVGLGKTVVGLNKTVSGIGETVVGIGESMAVLGEKLTVNLGKQIIGLGDQDMVRSISKSFSNELFNGEGGITGFGKKLTNIPAKVQKDQDERREAREALAKDEDDDDEDDEEDNLSKTSLDIKVEIELNNLEIEIEKKEEKKKEKRTINIDTKNTIESSKSFEGSSSNKDIAVSPSSMNSSLSSKQSRTSRNSKSITGKKKEGNPNISSSSNKKKSPSVSDESSSSGGGSGDGGIDSGVSTSGKLSAAVSPSSWRRALTTSLDNIPPMGTPIPSLSPPRNNQSRNKNKSAVAL